VQSLKVKVVADPSARLEAVATRVLALATQGAAAWPSDEPGGDGFDGVALVRSLRAADARYGTMRLGLPIAGDGTTTATWAIDGERGRVELRVTLDGAEGPVAAVVLWSPWRAVMDEGW
jgi:hypothetical protein